MSTVIVLHFAGKESKFKIYKGTTVTDIVGNIREITSFNDFVCLDKDGLVTAVSSYLPNGTHIFVKPKAKTNQNSTMDDNKNDNNDVAEIPLIYGYADRHSKGNQTAYKPQSSAVIFNNTSTAPRCNIGNMLNTQNGRFTAPITGIYSFSVSVWFTKSIKDSQLWFNYNGSRQQTIASPILVVAPFIYTGSLIVKINKNDFIDFRIYHKNNVQGEILENFHHTYVRWALIRSV